VRDKTTKVSVKFTEQQLVLIDQVLAEQNLGKTREEVIASMFRQYVRQTIGAVR
jgi:metal-responsive CopG/Arc/MetJ family transcriptional regulator